MQKKFTLLNNRKTNLMGKSRFVIRENSFLIFVLFVLLILGFGGSARAADIYVDQTLSQNITDGKYSIANRDNSGSDGDCYTTPLAAVTAMNGGDDIYLRGGTYLLGGCSIYIAPEKSGTEQDWSSIQSYPGEWAILDGESNIPATDNHGALIGYSAFGGGTLAYWKFERLEITGAGDYDNKFAAIWVENGPFIVRYCYIHDNSCVRAGISNSGAIVGHTWHDSIIEYNYFYNNVGINDNYGSDICVYSDYKSPQDVDINEATRKNTIRYNYFLDGQQSIKYKSVQYLSLDHSGNHTTYKDYGDDIHHNIIKNAGNQHVFNQDFIQVHQNIFESCFDIQTVQTSAPGYRERFYSTFYNNLFLRTRFHISRNEDTTCTADKNYCVPEDYSDLHPHVYAYNNIIEDVEGIAKGKTNELTIFFDWDTGVNWENELNWDTVDINYNLFYPDAQTDSR